jgi:DNA-binding transcriptional MerR regulator
MTMLSPGEACKKLHIQPSTLRKYSLLFEKEQIVFVRNKNNARLYTVTEIAALQEVVTAMKDGHETLENAVTRAAGKLKGNSIVAVENADTGTPSERHNDDIAAATMEEVRALREEIKKRDLLFVEALESLQKEIRELRQERDQLQIESQEPPADPIEQKPGKWWARFWKK